MQYIRALIYASFVMILVQGLEVRPALALPFTKVGEAFNEELTSDRPDFTEATTVVPDGHYQLEAGLARTDDTVMPEALSRIGLFSVFDRDVEFRLVTPNYNYNDREWGEFSYGTKFAIFETESFAVSDVVEYQEADGWQNKLLLGYDFSDDFGVASNINFLERGEWAASLSLGVSLTQDVGSYIEYYNEDLTPRDYHTLNGGFTYLLNSNLQLDVRLGYEFTEDSLFHGYGLVWRI